MAQVVEPLMVSGVVRDGVVVPDDAERLTEGARVRIVLPPSDVPAELTAEMAAWDQAGADAWAMISEWEGEAAE